MTQLTGSNNLNIKHYFSDTSNYWVINKNWYIVRNDSNKRFEGPWWQKYFYSLNYVPTKSFNEPGHHEEMKQAEATKKKIMEYAALFLLGSYFFSITGMPRYLYYNLSEASKYFFFITL